MKFSDYINIAQILVAIALTVVILLQAKGSLFATRPTLNTYAAKREDLLAIAGGLFGIVASGSLDGGYPKTVPIRGRNWKEYRFEATQPVRYLAWAISKFSRTPAKPSPSSLHAIGTTSVFDTPQRSLR